VAVTTYLTWICFDGEAGSLPEKTHRLSAIAAKTAKVAAEIMALRCAPYDQVSVSVGVLRADLLERKYAFTRHYTVTFARTVKEVRRA
jgi:hypothetical protein